MRFKNNIKKVHNIELSKRIHDLCMILLYYGNLKLIIKQ